MSFAGNPDSAATAGFCPAPPPPPPPPPVPGQTPALRISTAEAPRPRRGQNNLSSTTDPYEPPAAIQNAMMTKDKKPFTYTPGMGGKLDLSQIRSPRMARRVAKNANDEGIEGPPKSTLEQKTVPTSTPGGNLYVQPQVAVPVFPTNINQQPNVNRTPNTNLNRAPSNAWSSQPEPRRVEQKISQVSVTPVVVPSSPQSPTTPPQVTLAKAPTPWLQNKPKPQEELPEWAKRANAPRSVDLPIESPTSPTSPIQHQPQQFYVQANPSPPTPQPQIVQRQPSVQKVVSSQPRQQQDRVIPVRVEDRPSVFSVKNEQGHHQFKQPPNQQQRWGQQQQQQQQQQSGSTRIIPIMVEDESQPQPQSQIRTIPIEVVQGPKVIIQRGPPGPPSPVEPGPVQSRSFRVLQKITDTDSDTDVDGNSEQIRKLQLTEDDKTLMNKFKEQVDGETYLHQEEDPRYRGAAIPSRAFRFLQNMTESGEVPSTSNAGPRPASAINKKQNRNSKSFEDAQAGLPPSEQQVQEPKKYMGSAIPSRSFRILQAMTSPENIAPQENRQQDFTSRTENSQTGNQQSGLYYPNCPSPYWSPEGGWWGYYPYQYAAPPPPSPQNTPTPNTPQGMNLAYNPYAYYGYAAAGDGTPYAYYHHHHHQPIYDQNYAQSWGQSFEIQPEANGEVKIEGEGEGEGEGRQTPCQSQNQSQTQCRQIDPNSYFIQGYNEKVPFNNEEINNEANIARGKINAEFKDRVNENENCISKKEIDYLTVPKWANSNKALSVNGEVKKNLDIDKKRKLENDHSINAGNLKTDTESEDSDSDSDSDSSDSESSDDSSDSSSSSNSDTETDSEYVAYTNEVINDKNNNKEESLIDEPLKSNSEKDFLKSLSATTISEDGLEQSSKLSSDKISCSDCDSDADDEYQIESLNNDCILPHQLSVIYEDIEQTETENESKKLDSLEEVVNSDVKIFEEIGDSIDDDGDDTTVSVSLPLRFKFSVSDNDEDVTTVIVGDSTIKAGNKLQDKDDKLTSNCSNFNKNYEDNEVHVNFSIKKIDNNSVDFTLKRQKELPPNESFDTEFTLTTDEAGIELKESFEKNIKVEGNNIEDKENMKKINCNDNIETEFTIRRKKTDVTRHIWSKELDLDVENEVIETFVKNDESNEDTETEYTVKSYPDETGHDIEYEVTTSTSAIEDNVHKEIVEKKSLIIAERESVKTEFSVKKLQRNSESDEHNDNKIESPLLRGNGSPPNKRLLCVQNSKDETDDEDSGVTSDMSRIISEADTDDSESASIRRMNKYQRTQTHSRLFKLLNDDAVLAEEDSSEEFYSPGRREHLCLPLKATVFNYDENYYSNYSSGITSPDYSPLCEQSWKRIHEGRSLESDSSAVTTPNESIDLGDAIHYGVFQTSDKPAPTDDPYFQTWKKVASPIDFDPSYDILPSIAFKKLKKLENNRINGSGGGGGGGGGGNYHPRILCPRIKSSKNIPQTLQSLRKSTPSSIPFLATISSLKNGHC